MNSKYTVIDLFAGAGGLSKAFQKAGADVVWANEIDKYACNLYRENFKDACLVEGDIKNIESEDIPDFDILVGGFPCQHFSIAGKSRELTDERRNLFYEIIRILKAKKPRAFLLENIKGLMSHDNGETFNIIVETLKDEGYYIKSEVLNSMEYGNIPHNKEKIYIVGFKEEKQYEMFEFAPKIELTMEIDYIIDFNNKKGDKYYYKEGSRYYSKFKKEVKRNDRVYQLKFQTNREERYCVKEYGFCPNLSSITRTQYVPVINNNYNIRKLTPSECFYFHGYFGINIPIKINDNILYKCAALCSPVAVVERIAKSIIKVLNNYDTFSEIDINGYVESDHKANNYDDIELVQNNKVNINAEDSNNYVYMNEKVDLHEDDILINMLKKVEDSKDSYKKGKALELLMKLLFEQVDGFHVDTNARTKTEEIDIFIRNESKSEFWKKESIFIIGECKNWTEKVGKNELVIFRSKIENRKDRVKLGFFISWNGFTETYTSEDLRGSKGDILIIPITGQQIKECIINGDIEAYLKYLYQKAVIL